MTFHDSLHMVVSFWTMRCGEEGGNHTRRKIWIEVRALPWPLPVGEWPSARSFLRWWGWCLPHRVEMVQKWPGPGCLGSEPQFPSLQNRILFSRCSKAGILLKRAFFFFLSPNCRVNLGRKVSPSLNFLVCAIKDDEKVDGSFQRQNEFPAARPCEGHPTSLVLTLRI